MKKITPQILEDLLGRGVEDVIVREDLEKKLISGKKLRIKLGIDPTNPSIHIGRASAIWKLRKFQDLGHQITLVIGTFTGPIFCIKNPTQYSRVMAPGIPSTRL